MRLTADKRIFVPAVVTLGTSVTNFHWVHTVLVGTAIVGTFKLSRPGTGVLLCVLNTRVSLKTSTTESLDIM